jgi:hypothetical protein
MIKTDARYKSAAAALKNTPRLLGDLQRISGTLSKRAIQEIKLEIEKVVQEGQLQPKNNPLGVEIKRFTGGIGYVDKPLLGSGSMLDGLKIKSKRLKAATAWRLVIEGRHKSGLSQKEMWKKHRTGATQTMTPRQIAAFIRLLGAMGKLKGPRVFGKGTITLPARDPFLLGFQNWKKSRSRKKIEKEAAKGLIGAIFG